MIELLRFFLEKLDFLAIAEFLRRRNNRKAAARLHLVLVQSYEIIELYRIILNELKDALESYERHDDSYRFYMPPAWIASLLQRQSSNLEVMDHLAYELLNEIRILDNRFEQAFRDIIPHKFGILFEAQGLLSSARLPLNEDDVRVFPAAADGTYRTLWFTEDAPEEDRHEAEKYLHGWYGTQKKIVDINIHDGDEFFRILKWYFETNNPYERLKVLEDVTASYRQALIENFTLEEILSDVGTISRYARSVG